MSHPDPLGGGAAVQPPIPVFIINYEVIVETTIALANGEEFISLGDEFKHEMLAREESYNQTTVESCFVLETGGISAW